jgi:hypothetical protein
LTLTAGRSKSMQCSMPAYSRHKAFNSAGQGCRTRLPGKAAGQGSRARLHAMVQCQYAESMVKLVENAVF